LYIRTSKPLENCRIEAPLRSNGVAVSGHCEHVVIRDCHGYDFYVLDAGTHVLRNSVIVCDAAQSVVVFGQAETGAVCTLRLENVLVRGTGKSTFFKAHRNSVVEVSRSTLLGLSMSIAGQSFTLRRSVIAGEPGPEIVVYPHTRWEADGNTYDAKYLRIGSAFYNAKTFSAYRRASGQDTSSTWTDVELTEPARGRFRASRSAPASGVDPDLLPLTHGNSEARR